MIQFINVSKYYSINSDKNGSLKSVFSFKDNNIRSTQNYFTSLHKVNFTIKKGDCVGIIGANGAGKSTILKLISKVILPSEGEVVIEGNVSSLLEVGAGFHMDLSGMDNVFLSGAILGLSQREVNEKLEEILLFSDLGNFIYEPVKYYSSGMMLRLAFSIGASLDSDILVIDEALSVGDSEFRKKCLDKIFKVISDGRTVVFVSHDTEQVKEICTKAIYIDAGEIVHDGNVASAIQLYSINMEI
ncbi:ABC transporter ATP-binding protein [Candidatus Enterovibrio altilux]|uniref:Teichoic acid export ATP-binding protein TagH n=1 Tax=Candidatus Enterovibrio altilux TaxID=1927128 RepID=A0A291BAZ9_9GAMM|nr:ABC transporter ATP-binding protein [Candidatus Enterovibrio luxaltus]ATF10173.1 Teichoic acid export ATP-binding protein TagH [Candidatus Enterovibrio luxaltus]